MATDSAPAGTLARFLYAGWTLYGLHDPLMRTWIATLLAPFVFHETVDPARLAVGAEGDFLVTHGIGGTSAGAP